MSDSEYSEEENIGERYCHDDWFSTVQELVDLLDKKYYMDHFKYVDINAIIAIVDDYMLDPNRDYKIPKKDATENELESYAFLARTIMDNPTYLIRERDCYYFRDTIYNFFCDVY